MKRAVISSAAVSLALAGALAPRPRRPTRAPAQSSTAARAAHDATVKAQTITYDLMRNGTRIGSVRLYRIGSTRSRVRVELANPADNALKLALIPGSECTSNRTAAAASAIPLNPVNSSQISETMVNLPLTNLQGNYLVQAHNATQRAQLADACARLSR